MKWVWTWSGKCFGYIDGDDLWTYDGKHVARITDNEIYDKNGYYMGEIMADNFLITNNGKQSWRAASFTPYSNRSGYAKYGDYSGYAMYAGHSDFPKPEEC